MEPRLKTMWPGPRPTSTPSAILIQPFGHNTSTSQTDTQTDNGPIGWGETFLGGRL